MADLSQAALEDLAEFVDAGRMGMPGARVRRFELPENGLRGEEIHCAWSVDGADAVRLRLEGEGIDRGWAVASRGRQRLDPLEPGLYTVRIEAVRDQEVTQQERVLAIRERKPDLQVTLAERIFVLGGPALTLRWNTEHAAQVRLILDGVETIAATRGHAEIAPQAPGKHALQVIAMGAGGASTSSFDLRTVVPPVEFKLDVPRPSFGDSACVTWRVRNATDLTLEIDGYAPTPVPLSAHCELGAVTTSVCLRFTATARDLRSVVREVTVAPAILAALSRPVALSTIRSPLRLNLN